MRGRELLAYTLFLTWIVGTVGIQIGIAHGRYLQKLDDLRQVDASVLDEFMWQIPADAQVKKKRDCAMLADALLAVGWNPVLIPTMVAISRAEAGCNPLARLRTMREDSTGALQLNLRVHGQWISEWCATDDVCAARAALKVFHQQGLSAWTSYRTGAWRKFIEVSE